MEIDTDPLEGSSYDLGVTVKAEIKEEEEDENYNTMALTGASDRVARPLRVACEQHGDRDPAETQNKMAPFTSCEDERLIELIYRNPPIYDARLQSYKDNIVRENIWEDIGKRMKKTSNECKKRWKYIRDSYSRCKRKTKQSPGSSTSSKITKWLLYEKLRFLEEIPTERKSIANVQDNYIKEENNEDIGTGKGERVGMSGEESSGEEASNEGEIGKAGASAQTMTIVEINGAEIDKAGRTGLKRTREETSNEGPSGEEIGKYEATVLKRTRHSTNEVGTNEMAIGGEIGKAGTSGLEKSTEETGGEETCNKNAVVPEICEDGTRELTISREERGGDNINNKVIIGGGIPTTRVQRRRRRQPKNNLQTALLQYLKERDQQRQERIRTLTAQESDGVNSFCSYIGSILRKLSPSLMVEAKMEVFNLLTGYELKSLERKSSFSPLSNVTCNSLSQLSPNYVASVTDPADLSTPSLYRVAPDDGNCEGYEEPTVLENNIFFGSM